MNNTWCPDIYAVFSYFKRKFRTDLIWGCFIVAEIWPLYTGSELNLRDRVLGEAEKNRFIALPRKGGHSGLMPSRLCVPIGGGSEESYSNGSRSRVVDKERVHAGPTYFSIQRSSEDHQSRHQVVSWWASVVFEVIELWPSLWDEECLQRGECKGECSKEKNTRCNDKTKQKQ